MLTILFAGVVFYSCSDNIDEPEEIVENSRIYLNPGDSLAMVKIYEGLKLKESGQEWVLTDPFSWPGIHYEIISEIAYVKSIRINSWPNNNPVTNEKLAVIPDEIGELSHLRHLSLTDIYLWNNFPDSFFDLPIEELSLARIYGTNLLDDRISKLAPTLKNLSVVGCIIDRLPEGLADLQNLEILDLPANGIKGKVPDFFFRYKCDVYLYNNWFDSLDWDILYETLENGYSIPMLYGNCLRGVIPSKFETAYWEETLRKYLFSQHALELTYEDGESWPRSTY
jgi:hypothetical protein